MIGDRYRVIKVITLWADGVVRRMTVELSRLNNTRCLPLMTVAPRWCSQSETVYRFCTEKQGEIETNGDPIFGGRDGEDSH